MTKLTLIALLLASSTHAQTDKVAHFGVGYALGSVSNGLVLTFSNGKFEWADVGATTLGSLLGSFTIKISINRYEKKHLL